jgi:hypothetical protein
MRIMLYTNLSKLYADRVSRLMNSYQGVRVPWRLNLLEKEVPLW